MMKDLGWAAQFGPTFHFVTLNMVTGPVTCESGEMHTEFDCLVSWFAYNQH